MSAIRRIKLRKTIDDHICKEIDVFHTDMNAIRKIRLREIKHLQTDMKIIDQKEIKRAISKISDHNFSVLNEIE
jgi:hypothetical protein